MSEGTRVAGVVMAAGSSVRLGRNKLLLKIGGEPLVRRSVQAALAAGLDPVIVVLGHEAGHVREALSGLPCRTVLNENHAQGARTSLQCGIRAVSPDAGAAVTLLADMPFVTAAMIRSVADRYRHDRPPLVISRYGEVQAPPTLYDRRLFDEILAVTEGRCGKEVVRRHRDEAAVVEMPEAALADVDTAEDLARAGERLGVPA